MIHRFYEKISLDINSANSEDSEEAWQIHENQKSQTRVVYFKGKEKQMQNAL